MIRSFPLSAATLFAASLLTTSCDSELLTVTDDFDAPAVTFELPATDEAGAFTAVATVDDVDLEERLSDNDLSEGNLRSVVVQSMTATINDPEGEFDFGDVGAGTVVFTGASLGTVTVAELPSAASGTSVTLAVADDDIKAFLLADNFTANISGSTTAPVPEGVTVTVAAAYEFTGGL